MLCSHPCKTIVHANVCVCNCVSAVLCVYSGFACRAMNVFPKILSVIESQATIVYGDNSMKGAEFKGHVLNNLCSCK